MSRIPEMLVGGAIGDAFGLGVEMQGRKRLRNITFDRWHNYREGKYAAHYTPGEYSDDTEHTIAVVRAIMSGQPFTEDLLVQLFKEEYESDKEKKGYPRQGHGSIERYYKGEATIDEIRQSQARREHPGNAPPMRAAPLGLLKEDVLFEYSRINADATHPHDEARTASSLVALSAHYLLNGGDHKGLLTFCAEKDQFQSVRKTLLMVDGFRTPEEISLSEYEILCGSQPIKGATGDIQGLPCSSIHTAVTAAFILKHTEDPFLGLKRAIKIGGDVDSLASICLSILAGRYGLESLPRFMAEEVEGRERLASLGEALKAFVTSSL